MTPTEFEQDHQGSQFLDVLDDAYKAETGVDFPALLQFLSDPKSVRLMQEAEARFGLPALAGVVRELEQRPDFDRFHRSVSGHKVVRLHQAVGVAVRMIMERHGWTTTGIKGQLGTRVKVPTGTSTPGAYHNVPGSISHWFVESERYEPPASSPYHQLWRHAQSDSELVTA